MYRKAIEELKQWKTKTNRKPLVIEGARQVGKTWLMKYFGKTQYKDTVYVNFDADPRMTSLFDADLNPKRLITGIEILFNKKIIPGETLIIFDEIQEVPRALAALKYFCEDMPDYHIVCAGSLLGIALHEGTSFPVGKTDFLRLYPLSFTEFLIADGKQDLVDLIEQNDFQMVTIFREQYIDALKHYYFIGGMPEAVNSYVNEKDFEAVRQIQRNILNAYEQDFSKHVPVSLLPKVRMIWHSIPSQLAKENKKFIYGLVREGARAKDFETAIMWLSDCGLIHKVSRVTAGRFPLAAYEDLKAFKLFIGDIGLLGCMSGLNLRTLLEGNALFTEFKGALTEQFVLQELKTLPNIQCYYYTNDRGSCEVNFAADTGDAVIPLEVKAEVNLKAKSLKIFREKFDLPFAMRVSMADYKREEKLINLPLYAIELLPDINY